MASQDGKPGWHVTFEGGVIGDYTPERVSRDWTNVAWTSFGNRASIVRDPASSSSKVLEVAYPDGAVGPEEGGAQFLVELSPSRELWLSYDVRFGKEFDFRLGGKLPGLTSGGSMYTGGNRPENGQGWSARFMWLKGGQAVVYLYHADMEGKWGENLPLDGFAFTPGRWHCVTQYIKVNSPDRANGTLEVWADGRKVLSRSDIRFRAGHRGLIDSFYFSTFHGGNSRKWGPKRESFAFFDNFRVSDAPAPDCR